MFLDFVNGCCVATSPTKHIDIHNNNNNTGSRLKETVIKFKVYTDFCILETDDNLTINTTKKKQQQQQQ